MNNKGFTLVEIIAVVAILGLLAIITTPAYETISNNIKTRNYESKKNTIKSQTLSYVEKYFKDKVYDGTNSYNYCYTVDYLIENGIISSDSDKDEYIENNVTGEKYSDGIEYIKIFYDSNKFKLKAIVKGDENYNSNACTYCNNKIGGC